MRVWCCFWMMFASADEPTTVSIVPPSGTYPSTWRADVAFLAQTKEPILSQTIRFDGMDVTKMVMEKCHRGTPAKGGQMHRCASQFGSGGVAKPGDHTLVYTVVTASGTFETSTRYAVVAVSE